MELSIFVLPACGAPVEKRGCTTQPSFEPVPMAILLRAMELLGPSAQDIATMDCIWMAFYFLLRPGEYANASGTARTPFHLDEVEFKIGDRHFFDAHLATPAQCQAATFVSLTFSNQKNGVKGEKLAHSVNHQPHACPVRAVMRRVSHLNRHRAPAHTPFMSSLITPAANAPLHQP